MRSELLRQTEHPRCPLGAALWAPRAGDLYAQVRRPGHLGGRRGDDQIGDGRHPVLASVGEQCENFERAAFDGRGLKKRLTAASLS